MLNGFDLSNWQKDAAAGAIPGDFAIMKATEGTGYVNPSCDRHYQQAKKAGKLLGVYHFASGGDAVAEADFFLKNIKGYIGEALMVLDWEGDAIKRGTAWATNWLWRVHEKTGIWPLIYMSQSVANSTAWADVAKNCGLWVARYPTSRNVGYEGGADWGKATTGPWKTIAIWQYTSTGRLSGYSGNLDLDHAYMTRDGWKAYANGGKVSGSTSSSGSDNKPVPVVDTLENESYKVTIERK